MPVILAQLFLLVDDVARSEASKQKRREYKRLWYQRNKEHCIAYTRAYEAKNNDADYLKAKSRIYSQRYRDKLNDRNPSNSTVRE